MFLLPPKLFIVPGIGNWISAGLPDKSVTVPLLDIKELISKYSKSTVWCPGSTI